MRSALDPRLIALAGAAGCVDATAFLRLDQIFPANQTGNTVLLGIAVGRGDWTAALRSGVSLIAFCAGVLVLGYIVRRRPRGGWGREAALALGAEAVLLLALVAVWHTAPVAVAIALAAVAMGMQSLAAHRVGVAGVSTTFVTGTITRLSERLAGGTIRASQDTTPALVWVFYLGGAIAGGALIRVDAGQAGMAVAAVAVGLVAVASVVRPVAPGP